MKKAFALTLALLLNSLFIIKAQSFDKGFPNPNEMYRADTKGSNSADILPVHGMRYFADTLYHKGELKTSKNLYTSELQYRFDLFDGTIQVELESGEERLLVEEDIVYFKLFINNDVILFLPANVPNGKKITLLQVIYRSPTMQLLKDLKTYNTVKYDNKQHHYYYEIHNDFHYYFNKGGRAPFTEVKLKAKSFVKVMPEKKSRIDHLFKSANNSGELTLTKLASIMKILDAKDETVE